MSFSDILALTDVFLGVLNRDFLVLIWMGVAEPTFSLKSLLDFLPIWDILLYPSFFCNLFISRKPINGRDWPARSPPDLNPCDFFLWGYLKSKVYCPKPRTLDDLENNIGLLQPNMIRRSMSLIIGPWRAFKPVQWRPFSEVENSFSVS